MAMLTIECRNCKSVHSLRGWVEKEDLIGTKYEHLTDTITEEELQILHKKGEVKDPWISTQKSLNARIAVPEM